MEQLAGLLPGAPGLAGVDNLATLPVVQTEILWEDLDEDLRLTLGPEEEQNLIADVLSQVQVAEDARRDRITTIQKVRNRYYLEKPDRKPFFEQGANFHVPFMRWVMDAVASRLKGALFQKPVVSVAGVQGRKDVQQAARIEPFLEWANREQLKLPMIYDEIIERVETDGVLFIKVPWRRTVRPFRRRRLKEERLVITDAATGLPELDGQNQAQVKLVRRYAVEELEEELYHGPAVEIATIEHFVQPNVHESSLDQQPFLAQEIFLNRSQLWAERERETTVDGKTQTVGLYKNVEKIVGFTRREDISAHRTEQQANTQEGVSNQIAGTAMVGEIRGYEVVWPYRTWRMAREPDLVDPEQFPSRVILTIAPEEKVMLRSVRYPFWDPEPETMWVKVFLIQKQGRAYNPSLGEILMTVQDELDTIHWQRSDATTVLILSFLTFLAEEGAADDLDKLVLGAKNVVSSITGIKLLADVIRTGLTAPGLDIEQIVLTMGKLLSGIWEPQLGGGSAGEQTATEIGSILREGSLKWSVMVERLGNSIIQVDERVLRRYAQFYPLVAPILSRVKGEDPDAIAELALEDLGFKYDLEMRGAAEAVSRELRAAKAFRVLTLSDTNIWFKSLLMSNPDGVYELVRTVLAEIDWPGGPEVLIGSKENALKTLKGMMLMLAQLAAGGAGGGARGNGQGPQTAGLRSPVADVLNASGMTPEVAGMGAQPGVGG